MTSPHRRWSKHPLITQNPKLEAVKHEYDHLTPAELCGVHLMMDEEDILPSRVATGMLTWMRYGRRSRARYLRSARAVLRSAGR